MISSRPPTASRAKSTSDSSNIASKFSTPRMVLWYLEEDGRVYLQIGFWVLNDRWRRLVVAVAGPND